MGKLWDKIKQLDPDQLFAYNTFKTVRIQDKRLGLLHYGFLFFVILYILVYTLLIEKKYLLTDTPQGSFRVTLRRPSEPTPLGDLPYCSQTAPSYRNFTNYPCYYYDEELVVFPVTEQSAMLAATRITETYKNLTCNWDDPTCTYDEYERQFAFYIADLERFTLMIDHAIYATNLDIQRNAQQMKGEILGLDGEPLIYESPNQVGIPGELDIMEMKLLFEAAGLQDLDFDCEVDGTDYDDPKTCRFTGIVLLVIIDYSNTFSFNTGDIRYKISVRQVQKTQFKSEQQIFYDDFPNSLLEWNRHGVRLLFKMTGTVGTFDFQTLLINIIAGAALVSFAAIAVDVMAIYLLPQSSSYRQYMYEDADINAAVKIQDDQPVEQEQIPSSSNEKTALLNDYQSIKE